MMDNKRFPIIQIPEHVVHTARSLSAWKTPIRRTQGFAEQPGQTRGHGDLLDTIGSLAAAKYLRELGIPGTLLFTWGGGDRADLEIADLLVNIKASSWGQFDGDMAYHLAIKEVEQEKGLNDIYWQVFVHLDDAAHVHICGWIDTNTSEFTMNSIDEIPNTGRCRGYWIASERLHLPCELPNHVMSRSGNLGRYR